MEWLWFIVHCILVCFIYVPFGLVALGCVVYLGYCVWLLIYEFSKYYIGRYLRDERRNSSIVNDKVGSSSK